MAQWLVVNNGSITGTGAVLGSMPTPPDGLTYVEADDALMAAYRAACQALRDDRRNGDNYPDLPLVLPTWNGSAVGLPADTRPKFRVTSSKAVIAADNVDFTTITVTLIDDYGGNAVTAYTANDVLLKTTNYVFKVNFVNGVAQFNFKTDKPQEWVLHSNPSRAVEGHEVHVVDAYWPTD